MPHRRTGVVDELDDERVVLADLADKRLRVLERRVGA
jgi:hypothetical protein